MKTPILSVTLAAVKDGIDAIKSALDDVAQAGRVIGKFDLAEKHAEEAAAEGEGDDTVVIDASELGEPPAKKARSNLLLTNGNGPSDPRGAVLSTAS